MKRYIDWFVVFIIWYSIFCVMYYFFHTKFEIIVFLGLANILANINKVDERK